MNKRSKTSKKGVIVKNSREFVDRNEGFSDVPNSKQRGSGVYALYNYYRLYYVGLTHRSLRSRLRKHTHDRHAKNWIRYSWYHIPRKDYVKDIESTLLRIISPSGNKIKGKFKKRKV